MKLMKIKEVAETISVHPQTVRRMVRRGDFPAPTHQVTRLRGNRWSEDAVRAWVRRHESDHKEETHDQ